MKKTLAFSILSALVVSASALGQLSQKYLDWFDSPVRFLMTAEEIQQFRSIKSEADAENFMALFWAKRDPTPATLRNEFREEFDRRVSFADDKFSNSFGRGAL